MVCPNGHDMILTKSNKYKNLDGTRRKNWICSNFPLCDYRVAATSDGTPKGIPSDSETRKLRAEVHAICYQRWNYEDKVERAKMYLWLRNNSKAGHIGQMNKDELYFVRDRLLRGKRI